MYSSNINFKLELAIETSISMSIAYACTWFASFRLELSVAASRLQLEFEPSVD